MRSIEEIMAAARLYGTVKLTEEEKEMMMEWAPKEHTHAFHCACGRTYEHDDYDELIKWRDKHLKSDCPA